MPRRARVQYENAFYHVMNRGRGRRWIFHGDEYYEAFLSTLEEAHERYEERCRGQVLTWYTPLHRHPSESGRPVTGVPTPRYVKNRAAWATRAAGHLRFYVTPV